MINKLTKNLLLTTLFLLTFFLVSSQTPAEITKFSGGSVTGSDVKYEDNKIIFTGDNSKVNFLDENGKTISSFENIQPQAPGRLAYL